ncbi:septation protein A [Leeia sp. TBRC 13508]|uniref:Inner membrane-spanning protein YciB n=1 Tax=Leeia speluncae TaxID=2884804 RepID=A0ABS8D2K6_9NEIS|nr:septation protein A [Leeia speluncae]MCB6182218.1 septation protein A [Leeia speluncae]
MKILFDLFPVILFFVAYKFTNQNIYIATGVTIAASIAQIIWLTLRKKKVDGALWFSTGLVTVMGGATLLFHNKSFIMWKPSILYWGFAAALLVAKYLFHRNLIELMMKQQISLPEKVWGSLNLVWAIFFVVMGGANLYVASNYPESFWVNFKLFGVLGLTLVFMIAQGLYLAKYIQEAKPTEPPSA